MSSKTYFFINSSAGSKTGTNDTNALYYSFQFPIQCLNIEYFTVRVCNSAIPIGWYNLNSYNNVLNYQVAAINYSVTLTPFQANINNFQATLVTALANNGHTFTCTYDATNNTMVLSAAFDYIILSTSTIKDFLGLDFTNGNIDATFSTTYKVTSNKAVDFSYTKNIQIRGTIFTNQMNVNTPTPINDVICIIPIIANFPNIIYYESTMAIKAETRKIDRCTFYIADSEGRTINMNNASWQFSLEVIKERKRVKVVK